MIFVTLGSQKFQFNRLLKKIDFLIEKKYITQDVFAQIGYSDYEPKNFKFKKFLSQSEFRDIIDKCDMVITHGGTGAIIGAVKKGKKTISIPRLKDFCEHVDDHQLQIVEQFSSLKFIIGVYDIDDLRDAINMSDDFKPKNYISNTNNIIKSIELFLQEN